ncbi:MAG: hypothetical protein J2P20_03805 [Pseudonocardia sp.]|nr:hypothetical protein [Pseudonocardia sp.]
MTRFILGAVAAAVVVADGIVLIGLTSTIPGNAVPVRAPVPAQTRVSAPPASSVTAPAPAPSAARPPVTAHPRPGGSSARGGARAGTGREGTRPKFTSPFEDRCRTGQIPGWLCRGLPR